MEDHGGGGGLRTMGVYRQERKKKKRQSERNTERNSKTEPNPEMKETQ